MSCARRKRVGYNKENQYVNCTLHVNNIMFTYRSPDPNIMVSDIPEKDLPHCSKENCKGLLRPHIVWFGENLNEQVLKQACKYCHEHIMCINVLLNPFAQLLRCLLCYISL